MPTPGWTRCQPLKRRIERDADGDAGGTGFPLTVTLDDADSPMPTLKLSQVERVELVARISANGDATAQPGDFESAPVRVDTGPDANAALMIDHVIE